MRVRRPLPSSAAATMSPLDSKATRPVAARPNGGGIRGRLPTIARTATAARITRHQDHEDWREARRRHALKGRLHGNPPSGDCPGRSLADRFRAPRASRRDSRRGSRERSRPARSRSGRSASRRAVMPVCPPTTLDPVPRIGVEGGAERPARAEQPRLRGSHGQRERLGNLGQRQVQVVVHDDERTLDGVELAKRMLERVVIGEGQGRVGDARDGRGRSAPPR